MPVAANRPTATSLGTKSAASIPFGLRKGRDFTLVKRTFGLREGHDLSLIKRTFVLQRTQCRKPTQGLLAPRWVINAL